MYVTAVFTDNRKLIGLYATEELAVKVVRELSAANPTCICYCEKERVMEYEMWYERLETLTPKAATCPH